MQRRFAVLVLLLVLPLLALYPAGRIWMAWEEVKIYQGSPPTSRSFDWVTWADDGERIVAQYVVPGSSASEAGLRVGDELQAIQFQSVYLLEDAQQIIQNTPPGDTRIYQVLRGDASFDIPVRLSSYPTFLYPISLALWQFTLWGFTLGAFVHVLGLTLAAPLALRSAPARYALLLIAVSSCWMFGNLVRILLIELAGPMYPGEPTAVLFEALTLIGLFGWIAFPLLLLYRLHHLVLSDVADGKRLAFSIWLATPTVILGCTALYAAIVGPLGPFNLQALLTPILFYASCYIAVASFLMASASSIVPDDQTVPRWNRTGSFIIGGVAVLAGLAVTDVLPLLSRVDEQTAGWLMVSTQLLSVAPVALVSITTLQYGKVDQVLRRGLTYLTVYGLLFFAVVGGQSVIDRYTPQLGVSRSVLMGFYLVLLLILAERLARPLRIYAAQFFATAQQRKRQELLAFTERMRNFVVPETLVQETIRAVGDALDARSALIFLCPQGLDGEIISSTYHPEPPYLTERVIRRLWPYVEAEGAIWSANPELNESRLPHGIAKLLTERQASLLIPVRGDDQPIGLMVLGTKRTRFAVYNLEDLDRLRTVSSQLTLALERLVLVEREKKLAQQHTEATLVALRAQINPHFLFNALNTIIALIAEKPDQAEAAVEDLAAIFRHILTTSSRTFVSLEEEFTLVHRYLNIEKARFGSKLVIELPDATEFRMLPVPAFAVQTLVENAVKHGLEPKRGKKKLTLSVHETDDVVQIAVRDNGVGLSAEPSQVQEGSFYGIGLRNVADRLEQLYKRADLLQFESTPGSGTTVLLSIPRLRESVSPDASDAAMSPSGL